MNRELEEMNHEERQTEVALERFAKAWEADSAPRDGRAFLTSFRQRLDDLKETNLESAAVVDTRTLRRRQTDRVPVRLGRIAAIASVAAAAIVAVVLLSPFQRESPGMVLFSRGDVAVTGPGKFSRTMTLSTGPAGQSVITVDQSRVSLLLHRDSSLSIVDQDTIRLTSGELWTSVEKDSGFFEVLTPHGRVVVHGTTFGVRVGAEETVVSLADGKVSILTSGREDKLLPNMTAKITGASRSVSIMPEEEPVPAWVPVLHEAYIAHEMGRYYPSLQPK